MNLIFCHEHTDIEICLNAAHNFCTMINNCNGEGCTVDIVEIGTVFFLSFVLFFLPLPKRSNKAQIKMINSPIYISIYITVLIQVHSIGGDHFKMLHKSLQPLAIVCGAPCPNFCEPFYSLLSVFITPAYDVFCFLYLCSVLLTLYITIVYSLGILHSIA